MSEAGSPYRALLPDGRRWHFQHGPIDLILEAFGEPGEVDSAVGQAWTSFEQMLGTLVEELPFLRRPIGEPKPRLSGPVAGRMVRAVWPHRHVFVTPMAAVAGSVADEVLSAMVEGRRLRRAYVNDGGDIAFHLQPGERFQTGLITNLRAPAVDGVATLSAEMPVRGIATSGREGRSLSLGVADSVTVLARDGAAADVAATLIANAVDVDHPAIERVPAVEIDPASDLGERRVTVSAGVMEEEAVREALESGVRRAEEMRRAGLIHGALLALAGIARLVGDMGLQEAPRGQDSVVEQAACLAEVERRRACLAEVVGSP